MPILYAIPVKLLGSGGFNGGGAKEASVPWALLENSRLTQPWKK